MAAQHDHDQTAAEAAAQRRREARDWWLGRTPEQVASRQRAQMKVDRVLGPLDRAGKTMVKTGLILTLTVTIPILLLIIVLA